MPFNRLSRKPIAALPVFFRLWLGQAPVSEIECGKIGLGSYFGAGLSPAQVAYGHKVNDQPDIVVEPNGELLPNTSYFPHRMLTASWGLG